MNDFNSNVLKAVNNHKVHLIKSELTEIENSFGLITSAIDQGEEDVASFLLDKDSVLQFLHSTVKWSIDTSKKEQAPSIQKIFTHGVPVSATPSYLHDTVIFKQDARPMLDIYRRTTDGVVLYVLDLRYFQHYFEENSLDARSYFELYDALGHCLLHPDTTKIGSLNVTDFNTITNDTIIQSDFLDVPVLRTSYSIGGLLKDTKLFVNVPIMMTEVEISDIGGFSLLLSVSGIIVMIGLILVLNAERRKSERLTLHNLAYQKEEALLKFENLKRKFDPHFLFNALGSLQQLIKKDPQLAQTFVGKLARVYRKFISTDEDNLSSIKEEVQLAKEYFFLQKIRFGASLEDIDFRIHPEYLSHRIPKFSLQILIENAIKHNEISLENPLIIHCYTNDETLIVENKLSPRISIDASNGYGTLLITKVYDYYQVQGFSAHQNEHVFRVTLPIITT